METGFLLDYFLTDKSKIHDWKTSSNKDRLKKYSPASIRQVLDQRDGFKDKQREQMYKLLCEYAAHPTYPGFKLIAPKGSGEIGPFFNAKYLKGTIEELLKDKIKIIGKNVGIKIEKNDVLHIFAKGSLKGSKKLKEEEHDIILKLNKTVCQDCSRMFGGYYEAILQLRGEVADIMDFIDDQMIKEKKIYNHNKVAILDAPCYVKDARIVKFNFYFIMFLKSTLLISNILILACIPFPLAI